MEAFRLASAYGYDLIDGGDWWTTSDGALVCIHDSTYDRTTTRSGNVADASATAAMQAVVDASVWFGGGFSDTRLPTEADFFNTFATAHSICPEPKNAAAAVLLAHEIERLGLQHTSLPNSFSREWLQPFLDVGCSNVLLNILAMPSSGTRAQYLADGVNWIGVTYNGSVTPANVLTLVSEGFEVLVGTVTRGTDATATHDWLAIKASISAWASDDPLYFAHVLDSANAARYRRTTDPFESQAYYHGHHAITGIPPVSQALRGTFRGGDRWGFPATQDSWVLQGWACPLSTPTDYTIDFNLTFDGIGSSTSRWGGVFFGMTADHGYRDLNQSTETGYQFWCRASGSCELVEKAAGVPQGSTQSTTSNQAISAPLTLSSGLSAGVAITALPVTAIPSNLASGARFKLPTGQVATLSGAATAGATSVAVTSITPSAAVASGAAIPQTVPLRIDVTPTTITCTRVDTSQTVSLTDSSVRGPYFYFGQSSTSGGATGFSCSFSDVVIS